jgi:hypothetical protein
MSERERTVYGGEAHVSAGWRRKALSDLIAVGHHMGEQIEVEDRSEVSAVARWGDGARRPSEAGQEIPRHSKRRSSKPFKNPMKQARFAAQW